MQKKWKVAGTFVAGLSHEKHNIVCHDRFSQKALNNVTCISLADGAGSVQFPEIGAYISSDQVNETLAKNFDCLYLSDISNIRHKLIHAIRTRLGIIAKKKSVPIREFASTLIFVSVKDNNFIAGHIGDGILAYLENGELKLLSPPDKGEFVNETYFVTSSSYKTRFRIFKGELNQISGFILMTDGTCDSLFDKKNRKVAPILLTLLNWLDSYPEEEVNHALKENFENVIKKKTTDDCSIGLMKLSVHSFVIDENELVME